MSSPETLARPYAKAAFELAEGRDDLATWHGWLAGAAAATTDETMARWLKSPELDRTSAVDLIARSAGTEDEHFGRYLGVLAVNGRLPLLPQITELYGRLREAAEGRLNVRVVSAIPLEADQAERMSAALARRFDCEIELENEVDKSVLGGAVIYAGDEVIDGSLRGRLGKLESSLS